MTAKKWAKKCSVGNVFDDFSMKKKKSHPKEKIHPRLLLYPASSRPNNLAAGIFSGRFYALSLAEDHFIDGQQIGTKNKTEQRRSRVTRPIIVHFGSGLGVGLGVGLGLRPYLDPTKK